MQLFSNNFKTTLSAAVDNVTTSITVVSSVGLPTLGVGDTVLVTLESTDRLVVEIVEVTAVVGNVLTVVRGREGTVASSFGLGSFVEGRLTAGWLNQVGAELGGKQDTITGAATTITSSNLTASMALVSDASGKVAAHGTVSATELGYLDGVTSAIQTQLDGKATASHTHSDATTSVAGFMSAADKTKLDGVATGATNYTHPTGDGNLHVPATGTTNNGKVLTAGATAGSLSWTAIPAATVSSVAGKTGVVTLTKTDVGLGNVDNTADSDKAVLSATKLATARTLALSGTVTGSATFDGSANMTISTTVANATTSTSGLMSNTDKSKLDGIAANANNYSHPTGDGNLHVPATGTTNNGKVLTAGATAGSLSWTSVPAASVSSVAGKTGVVTLVKGDVGLGNVENTADSAKSVASARSLTTARTINGVSFDGTANITISDATKAPLDSPALTGTPTAPTAAVGTNTTQIATTAFVRANSVTTTGDQTIAGVKTFSSSPSVPTATTSGQPVNLGQFVNSLGASGWQKLPNGLIIQWGDSILTTNAGGSGVFTYPITFPNSVFTVMVSGGDNSTVTPYVRINSQMVLAKCGFQTTSANTLIRVTFIAIGK